MTTKQRRRGFTLVELLIVIGIIALLLSIMVPTIGRARLSARQVRSMSGLRQMLTGYLQYHIENRGCVLLGYTPATVNGRPVTVEAPSGHVFGLPVADRYPWRLAPYVGNIWEVIHSHAEVPPQPLSGDSASVAMSKAYTLSLNPTYGINSVFVGGHLGPIYQGFAGPNGDEPNAGKHVVFRASEVRRSSELIVFADSQMRNGPVGSAADAGLHYLTPPRANGENWRVGAGGRIEIVREGMIMGLPEGRYKQGTVTGFFDGHVASLSTKELLDMRLWANSADREDYDFAP